MSTTWTTFLYETVNFLLLAGVLAWLLFRPVRQAVEDRRNALRKQADEARRTLEEAAGTRAEVEARLARCDEEIAARRKSAADEIAGTKEAAVAEARRLADAELAAARRRAVLVERERIDAWARTLAATAGSLVDRLLSQLDAGDLEAALRRRACDEARGLAKDGTFDVVVETVGDLADDERERLRQELAPVAASIEFRVDEALLGGIRLRTSLGLIDASLAGLVRHARDELASRTTDALESEPETTAPREPTGSARAPSQPVETAAPTGPDGDGRRSDG